jgi:hypothetical protein
VRDDGALRLVGGGVPDAPDAVSWSWVTFRGRELASTALENADAPRIVLWRLDEPPRLDTLTEGVRPNGDVYDEASVTAYDCGRGRLDLNAFAKADETVTLTEGARVLDTRHLTNGEPWTLSVATLPSRSRVCRFAITTDGLLATTKFAWTRA